MRRRAVTIPLTALVALVALQAGCNRDRIPVATAPPTAAPQTEMLDLSQRARQLDSNNQDLHSELSNSLRQNKLQNDEIVLLKERLGTAVAQLRDERTARAEAEQRIEAMQASTRGGGVSLKANNSVAGSLRAVKIPGLEVVQEQDVIRIVLPSGDLFQEGTVDYRPGAERLIEQAAYAIAQDYRRQRVIVEAHTDGGSTSGRVTPHELTASQGLRVSDSLLRVGRLPPKQISILSMGDNDPRASNATAAGRRRNRRIELVIYPERYR